MGADLARVEGANLADAPGVPALPAAALGRLPVAVGLDADPYWRLAAAFLVGYQGHSRSAYFSDLRAWHVWCTGRGVHPLAVERHHIDAWITYLTEVPQPRTGRPASPATIGRRLSCLSQFYEYAVRDAELLDVSPMARVRRPRVDDDSATVGLDRDELGRLLGAAEADGPRSTALISLLVCNGLRISEALSRDVEHFTYQTGHRVLRLTRKGGKRSTEALAPVTVHALEPGWLRG
jgi:integrase/recombinase XerD